MKLVCRRTIGEGSSGVSIIVSIDQVGNADLNILILSIGVNYSFFHKY